MVPAHVNFQIQHATVVAEMIRIATTVILDMSARRNALAVIVYRQL